MATSPEMDSEASPEWVRRYLALLGANEEEPSLTALSKLTRAQILNVAFENVTAQLRRASTPVGAVPPIDPDALLDSWESGRGGGVCFELAPMFGRLLNALGYNATLILAQISFPGSHNALLVELDDAPYLVDVSNGAPFFSPIPLDRVTEVKEAGLAYRFRPGESAEEWIQDRWVHEEWAPFCRYILQPADVRDREFGYQEHHTPGKSWVVDRLRLIRCREDEVFSLMDEELVHFSAEGKRTERIADPDALARLIAEVFWLPALLIDDVLRARAELADAT